MILDNNFLTSIEFMQNMYNKYLVNPTLLDPSWCEYFDKQLTTNTVVDVDIFRIYGHKYANTNPLEENTYSNPRLDPIIFNNAQLYDQYCCDIGVEFEHTEEKDWLYDNFESYNYQPDNCSISRYLTQTKVFEQYLHTKFQGAKRFSIEGSETFIVGLKYLIKFAATYHVQDIIIGMAHRGRLSALVQVLEQPCEDIFRGFMGNFCDQNMTGDVKYHWGYCNKIFIDQHNIQVSITPNPSHLESVNGVVLGQVRALQDQNKNAMCVMVHGDASICGQGSIMEILSMNQLNGYKINGTIHIVINNQIGFTTNPIDSRSTKYCTDIVKGFGIPVIHVNANNPTAVIKAIYLSIKYRQIFKKDIIIDVIGYRKYGHNEGDEPMFTQPILYNKIIKQNSITNNAEVEVEYIKILDEAYDKAKNPHIIQYKNTHQIISVPGLIKSEIEAIAPILTQIPENFHINSKIKKQLETKSMMFNTGKNFDWATAEAMAFASILKLGKNIRFSGQDVERGTFSHRHAVLIDQVNENKYIPLKQLGDFKIYNSLLSEYGVLGFEYGYNTTQTNGITIWEAQFGDFANGAQIIIDQYIAAAKAKWNINNNIILFLPHGYEGQGPEHSSARLERFLQLTADDNMIVCNCTTPASFFHLLRRQALGNITCPLIIMTPKSLLRRSTSNIEDFDGQFQTFIFDPAQEPL
jgi:2-oxoglutarate dehydrogenase E1 component